MMPDPQFPGSGLQADPHAAMRGGGYRKSSRRPIVRPNGSISSAARKCCSASHFRRGLWFLGLRLSTRHRVQPEFSAMSDPTTTSTASSRTRNEDSCASPKRKKEKNPSEDDWNSTSPTSPAVRAIAKSKRGAIRGTEVPKPIGEFFGGNSEPWTSKKIFSQPDGSPSGWTSTFYCPRRSAGVWHCCMSSLLMAKNWEEVTTLFPALPN